MSEKLRAILSSDKNARLIPLTQDQFSIVSAEDYESLMKHNWHARWCKGTQTYYVKRPLRRVAGKRSTVEMHRQVMNAPRGICVDHINGDTLDNRRSNLRFATTSQNAWNRKARSDSKTGLKGVRKHAKKEKWTAHIKRGGRQTFLGSFGTPELAHAAYISAAKEIAGEFARC